MKSKSQIISQIYCALAIISWTTWKYRQASDADDFVQTMLIAKSLIDRGGFDHADIVRRYREKPGYCLHGHEIGPSGLANEYHGQISKLIRSHDKMYLAEDGISDGAAMKIVPIVAFYLSDFTSMVKHIDLISRITHASTEARMSALLIALRLYQIILQNHDSKEELLDLLNRSMRILKWTNGANFMMERIRKASNLAEKYTNSKLLLLKLAEEIGIGHLAWSTPVTACFWSFCGCTNYNQWFEYQNQDEIDIDGTKIGTRILKKSVFEEDRNYLEQIQRLEEFQASHGHHWRKSIDVDTFFSIAFSLIAAEHGIDSIKKECNQAEQHFGENLYEISKCLVMPKKNSNS